ncbi:MAG: putative asparagine synthetase [glutamine-hydrolyzing] [Phycisphaerae bacterium]
MCGIAGLIRFAGLEPGEIGLGGAMAATLRHRGPDDLGTYADRFATLGHARLSIIDLKTGRQPLGNEDGSIQVVFNGEIYNHREIARRLRARGHVLHTRCDAEVIAHLYEDDGDDFVHALNGMFAIGLWDARRRRLVLVRDRLGVKPLYWHDDGRRVAFGSELKAVLAAGGVERRVDCRALADYLTFGHVPAPRTIFDAVRKLEPGFLAVITSEGAVVRRYWDIPPAGEDVPIEPRHFEQFAALLEDSVGLRLEADVPLGAFLSGGVDSGAVVTAMCRKAGGRVITQTVGFDRADHDERAAAAATAALLGTRHREALVEADAAAAAERLARHFDEPFADSSAVPTYYLSKVAREGLTVALSGDGADETLGGYRRYRFDLAEARVRAGCPRWLRRSLLGPAGRLYPKADWLPRPLRAKVTLTNLALDDVTAHLRSVSLRGGALPRTVLRPETDRLLGGYDPFQRGRELFDRYSSPHLLGRLLYLDMKTLLPDDMLTKVDRASMAVGLEVREPMLDYRLVEYAASLPPGLRLGKRVLRATLAGWAGLELARRPKKGFDVPLDDWCRGPLREMSHDLLTGAAAGTAEWLDPRVVRRLLRDHDRGLRSNGAVIWALMMLEHWARAYLRPSDRGGAAPHRGPEPRRRLEHAGCP